MLIDAVNAARPGAAAALILLAVVLGESAAPRSFGLQGQKLREKVMAVLGERANGRELEVSRGETFEIRLQERPTTGFRWQIAADGAPICVLVRDTFTPPSERVPGRAGRHSWTFRVERSGRATVELASRRQWEQKAAPAKTFRITVIAAD